MIRPVWWLPFVLILAAQGCRGNGPSDAEALAVVKEFVSSHGNLCDARLGGIGLKGVGEVTEFQIQERGTYNEQGKYLALKVRLKGFCEWMDLGGGKSTAPWEKKPYDDVMECKISKDDFGKWVVTDWKLSRTRR